jgi:hypothetical protein
MNEPTVARTSNGETARTGWPVPGVRSSVAPTPREPGRSVPELAGVDRVDVSRGDSQTQAYAKFSFNEKTGAVSIRIVDVRTDEVIREIPPERVAEIAEELQALARRTTPGGRLADGVPDGAPGIPDRGVDHYV